MYNTRRFQQEVSFSFWFGVTDLRRIDVLRHWAEQEYQARVINWAINFFNDVHHYVTVQRVYRLTDENRHHMDMIYDLIAGFEEFQENDNLRRRFDNAYNRLINVRDST